MVEYEWIFAAEEDNLKENVLQVVFPKGIPIMLLRKAGKIHAMLNKCAHMACELASGDLQDYVITWPCHEWRFDIRTGEFLDAGEIRIPTYETNVSNGKVLVKIGVKPS